MKWSSAVSEYPTIGDAIAECTDEILRALDGLSPDIVLAFPSAHYAQEFGNVPDLVYKRFKTGEIGRAHV